MLILRLALSIFFLASCAFAQISVTTSTAGIPVSQNDGNGGTSTAYPSGLGGKSTGTSINFQASSTGPPPSSSVISSTLTGEALSQELASLSQASERGKGSDGMYTSTTGGAISGISTGLSGGYNDPTPSTTGGASAISEGQTDSAFGNSLLIGNPVPLLLVISAFLMGAVVVL